MVRVPRPSAILRAFFARSFPPTQYATPVTKKGTKAPADAEKEDVKRSKHVERVLAERKKGARPFLPPTPFTHARADAKIDPLLEHQFAAGRLYAAISSRPGQSGRCDGYILEGQELEFYLRKLRTTKQKH